MAVQVGRTVISFTIKYVQSEKEKLKSDISKVLDSKKKVPKPDADAFTTPSQMMPLEMLQTGFGVNIAMEALDNQEDDEGDMDENMN